ncbi:MAG: 3-deoxy-8-phosphooctulonate synthase [Verrucomicrobia bacterium]|nr:3-deoxy-8-phosphooctulonate synthase [Verrucomicrobiota bacterium]
MDLDPKSLKLDENAKSADESLPAFLARPDDAPVYHGFPLVPETTTDGWCLGAITEYADPSGCESGDAFVVAPDGSRAGLVWDVGEGELMVICPPDNGRWGVFQVWFPKPTRDTADLVDCFRAILPALKQAFSEHQSGQTNPVS